jgi:hypothetical protein
MLAKAELLQGVTEQKNLPGAPMTIFCLSVQRVGVGALYSYQEEK